MHGGTDFLDFAVAPLLRYYGSRGYSGRYDASRYAMDGWPLSKGFVHAPMPEHGNSLGAFIVSFMKKKTDRALSQKQHHSVATSE